MDRRRATLILIATLVVADLTGVVLLREAWSAGHGRSAAARAMPAVASPDHGASAVHAGA